MLTSNTWNYEYNKIETGTKQLIYSNYIKFKHSLLN